MHHYGCHDNLVSIAIRYVADAYHPKSLYIKYELNTTRSEKGVTKLNVFDSDSLTHWTHKMDRQPLWRYLGHIFELKEINFCKTG